MQFAVINRFHMTFPTKSYRVFNFVNADVSIVFKGRGKLLYMYFFHTIRQLSHFEFKSDHFDQNSAGKKAGKYVVTSFNSAPAVRLEC